MQVAQLLKQPPGAGPALGAQDASMLVWALAVLHELDPDIWTALLDVIAAAPQESLDEVPRHTLSVLKPLGSFILDTQPTTLLY